MQYPSESVCGPMVERLWQAFETGLKTKQLIESIPEFCTHNIHRSTLEMAYSQLLPQPRRDDIGLEDPDPIQAPIDQNATFRIGLEDEEHQPVKVNPQSQSSDKLDEAHKSKRNGRKYSRERDPAATQRGVFALSEPILSEQDLHLDQEVGQVKQQLYFMRRLRKENEEAVRSRLQESLSRKEVELSGKDFAFDFSGDILARQKPNLNKSLLSPTTGKSVDFLPQKSAKNEINQQEDSSRDYLISRGVAGSREGKRLLFGNMGRRQVSHLPSIKLSDNSKLSQNSRNANGAETFRFSLKSYESRGESTFKHHFEFEKQKAERLYSLKRNSQLSETTEEYIEPLPVSATPKRQSKRMQKYLSKLCEDKNRSFVSEINKSCNFDRMNSPHDHSVHRYYRHNFDEDKRNICESSLASLKINTSFFKDVKFTQ